MVRALDFFLFIKYPQGPVPVCSSDGLRIRKSSWVNARGSTPRRALLLNLRAGTRVLAFLSSPRHALRLRSSGKEFEF